MNALREHQTVIDMLDVQNHLCSLLSGELPVDAEAAFITAFTGMTPAEEPSK